MAPKNFDRCELAVKRAITPRKKRLLADVEPDILLSEGGEVKEEAEFKNKAVARSDS